MSAALGTEVKGCEILERERRNSRKKLSLLKVHDGLAIIFDVIGGRRRRGKVGKVENDLKETSKKPHSYTGYSCTYECKCA